MDRNTLIGILLIAVILIGYALINKPSRERLEEAQRIRDSLANVQQVEADSLSRPVTGEQEQVQEEETVKDKVDDSEQIQVSLDDFGDFAGAAMGEKEMIVLENDLIRLTLSTKGGKPYSVLLKNYQTWDSLPLILFNGDSTVFGLNFFANNRSINTNELYFTPSREEKYIIIKDQPETISMRLKAGDDRYIEYVYTLAPDDFMVDFDMRFHHMQEIISERINFIDLNWEFYVPGHEQGRSNESNYTTIVFRHYQDEVERFSPKSKKDVMEKDITTRVQWVAFKQQFFSSVLIADDYMTNAYLISTKLDETNKFLKTFSAQLGIPYESKEEYDVPMAFYFGPNHITTLRKYGNDLDDLINLGGPLSRWINRYLVIPIFNFLNRFIGNYGIIILVLTIIIKVILFPLTYRSYKSMAKMRVLKPEIDAINEKIPKEKAMERQQATMGLYKKAGVSPLGGCLPMLLQMPILYAMFRFFPASIELRQERFLWAHDLSTYDSILNLPFNIPMYGDHVSLFTLLMTASTILTMRISNQASASSSQMPGMKGMMYIMPVMFMFILNQFSAALTYYYFLANIITFAQNQIFKQFINEDELRSKLQMNQKKTKKKSGFQKRLEDMAKKRGYSPTKR
jgi:YidC/Oxa1 family membrane protein insertase